MELSSDRDRTNVRLPHALVQIVLASRLPASPGVGPGLRVQPNLRDVQEIYEKLLFHGKDLHGIEFVEGCCEDGIIASVSCALGSGSVDRTAVAKFLAGRSAGADSAFQMMILWTFEQFGAGSLPCSADAIASSADRSRRRVCGSSPGSRRRASSDACRY